MTIYLFLIALSLAVLHSFIRYRKKGRLINKIPGPAPFPFFGNMLEFNISAVELWNKLQQLSDEYYPIYRLWGFKTFGVIVRHPDDIKVLLSCKKNIAKCHIVYDSFKTLGTEGLVFSSGDKWWQRRKMLNPAFSLNVLKIYVEIANEHAERCVHKLISENQLVVEIVPILMKLVLGIVCEAIMGVDPSSLGTEIEEEFRTSLDEIGGISFYRACRPYIQDWMMPFLNIGYRQKRAWKALRDFSEKIVHERKEYHKRAGFQSFESLIGDIEDDSSGVEKLKGRSKRLAVLDILLAAEMDGLIDKKGTQEETDIFTAAGYETSGLTVTFTLLLLAENKAVQELARAEVIKILEESKGIMKFAEIQKMDYLDRCVKETLRLYPGAPLIGRYISDELCLKNHTLPVSTEVIMNLYALHRDPKYWKNPTKFDPDRFLPENMIDQHPFSYVPFSAGVRNCIGQKFAMMEVKLIAAHILYNFILEPIDTTANLKFEVNVVLKPTNTLRVKLTRIERSNSSS